MAKQRDQTRDSSSSSNFPIVNVFIDSPTDQLTLASSGSIGHDLAYSGEDTEIKPGELSKKPTGVKLQMPNSIYCSLRIRSSLALKGLIIPNSPALIDSDYRGEVFVILFNLSQQSIQIRKGERIAQATFERRVRVNLRFSQGGSPLRI